MCVCVRVHHFFLVVFEICTCRCSSGSSGGLWGLKTTLVHEGGVLGTPLSLANITVKEHDGETGTSPPPGQVRPRLLFHAVAEFNNFGHTIKSHDHQTTCSAVFEMTTALGGPGRKSS